MEMEEGKNLNKEKIKLDLVMDNDPIISKLYREVYGEIKEQSEKSDRNYEELHSRFDQYLNKDVMSNKLDSEFFDLQKVNNEFVGQLSTDFSDFEDMVVYRKYKEMLYKNKRDYKMAWEERNALYVKKEVLEGDDEVEKPIKVILERDE
jgi:hypothetical protein